MKKIFPFVVFKVLHDYFIQYTGILTFQEQIKMIPFLHICQLLDLYHNPSPLFSKEKL